MASEEIFRRHFCNLGELICHIRKPTESLIEMVRLQMRIDVDPLDAGCVNNLARPISGDRTSCQ